MHSCHPWKLSCRVFTPGAGCQVSNATVFLYFSFHSYVFLFCFSLQTMSVMELWRVDIMLPISVTHVYHNFLRSASRTIYDICSYVAHVLSSFFSITTVFLAAFLSIINLPNLTMNMFIDACCGWTGKLTVPFYSMKFKQKNMLFNNLLCAYTHTKQKSVLQC